MFQGCGKPALGRRRRSTNLAPLVEPELIRNRRDLQNSDARLQDDSDIFILDEEHDKQQITKRSTPDSSSRELKYEPVQFSNGEIQFTNNNSPPSQHQAQASNGNSSRGNRRKNNRKQSEDEDNNREPIDRLVKDIRQRVKDSKRFWSNLPYMLCNNEDVAAPPASDGNCWNGHTVDRYSENELNDTVNIAQRLI